MERDLLSLAKLTLFPTGGGVFRMLSLGVPALPIFVLYFNIHHLNQFQTVSLQTMGTSKITVFLKNGLNYNLKLPGENSKFV